MRKLKKSDCLNGAHRSLEVNHIGLFSFGFLFYWILPLAIQPDLPLFETLTDQTIHQTLWIMFSIYLAFVAGDLAGRIMHFKPKVSPALGGFPITLFVFILGAVGFIIVKRGELFIAYGENLARGTLTTISFLFLTLALLRGSSRNEFDVKNLYFLSYFLLSVLLLLMGQRLYFVTSILVLISYRSCYFRRLEFRSVLFGCVTGLIIVLSVGVLRAGDAGYGLDSLIVNLLSEPIYTAISLFYFLKHQSLPVVAFPSALLFKFGNLVPSFLFPQKAELFINTDVYSPVGANNSFIGWMTNFGVIGSVVLAAALGLTLRWLRSKTTCLSRVIYPMLSAWLAFSFFRDDFAISIVKNMVENSILIPSLMFSFFLLAGRLPLNFCLISRRQHPPHSSF
jgi:hypothetical protein